MAGLLTEGRTPMTQAAQERIFILANQLADDFKASDEDYLTLKDALISAVAQTVYEVFGT